MPRRLKNTPRNLRRCQMAALNVIGLGLAFVLLPYLLKQSVPRRRIPAAGDNRLDHGAGRSPHGFFAAPATAAAARAGTSPPVCPRSTATRQCAATGRPPDPDIAGLAVQNAQAGPPLPRLSAWGPELFSAIEWRRFEAVVETLFAQAGFITKSQSHGPDEGVYVWLYSESQPDGAPVSVVQYKHWQRKRVGVDKVRELCGELASRDVMRGQFATTSTVTPDAIAFGAANGIKLHDLDGLLDVIARRTPEQRQSLMAVALEGEYWRPTCVNCGIKMIKRTAREGASAFWGCSNFPKGRTPCRCVRRATEQKGEQAGPDDRRGRP